MRLLYCILVSWTLGAVSAESRPDGTIACDPAQRPYVMNSPGFISTLGFNQGQDYENNLICEWLIDGGDKEVLITFGINSLVEDCIGCDCDGVQVYGQNSAGDTLLFNTFCGELDGESGVSTRTTLIRFVSDESIVFRGFQASIEFVDAACEVAGGAPVIDRSGFITSPGYPNNYPNGAACLWNLTPPGPGQVLQWQFVDLNLEDGCDFAGGIYDFVQFTEIGAETSDRILGRFYGSDFVPGWTYQSKGPNGVDLLFYSDQTIPGRGFNVSYAFVDA